ncbi:hypothetical protein BH20ACT2_BH20ACT2_09370 [soil metagenome]
MTPALRDVLRTLRASPIFSVYVLATLVVAAVIGLITVNVIDLGMTHFGEPFHRTHDIVYGALFATLALGMVAQLRNPQRNIAAVVMAQLPFAGLLLAAALAGDLDRIVEFNPLRNAAAVAVVVALLHPAGRTFLRSFSLPRISWPMIALVGIAAVPLLAVASTDIRLQQTVTDEHRFMGHYGFMAAFSYTVIGVGLLASLRPVGWRLSAWVAGLLPAVLGLTSLLYPGASSSLDAAWALAAIGWGVVFVAVAARTEDPAGSTVPCAHRASEPQPLVGASLARRPAMNIDPDDGSGQRGGA